MTQRPFDTNQLERFETCEREARITHFVYVVHGFGSVSVFATLHGATRWRNRHAKGCDIVKARIHGSGEAVQSEELVSERLVDVA